MLIATYLFNRLPPQILGWKCLFKVLMGKSPDYTRLLVFIGYLCYSTNVQPHEGKIDARSRKCVFVGYVYEYRGYKVFDLETQEMIITRDVKFYESHFPFKDMFLLKILLYQS